MPRRRLLLLVSVVALPLPGAARTAAAEPGDVPSGRHVVIHAGVGISGSERSDSAGLGTGGFLEGEYVFRARGFYAPGLYGGALVTFPDADSCAAPPCQVESKIVIVGAKARIMDPTAYVRPFGELGLGASLGYLRTLDGSVDETMEGATIHVPVALGLEIGRDTNIDLTLRFLLHPFNEQLAGTLGVGIGFPVL